MVDLFYAKRLGAELFCRVFVSADESTNRLERQRGEHHNRRKGDGGKNGETHCGTRQYVPPGGRTHDSISAGTRPGICGVLVSRTCRWIAMR